MKAGDLGELALRNLREALLRNSLTTLGIAVGVASLVAMLSLGVGLQELATKRLSNSGLFDTIIVMSKSGLRGFGRPSEPPRRAAAGSEQSSEQDHAPRVSPPLDDAAREALQKLPNVVEVYPQIRFPTEVRFASKPYATIVAGIPDSARGNGAFDGINGNFFSGANADEAILQSEFAKDSLGEAFEPDRQRSGAALCGKAAVGDAGCRSEQFVRRRKQRQRERRVLRRAAREESSHRWNR